MTVALNDAAGMLEKVLVGGDLSKLSAQERLGFYQRTCESMGLNPLTQPFAYITLNGKLTLYAKRDATDQLRKLHGISIDITAREMLDDVYVVTAKATDKGGRADVSTGAVPIKGLLGEAKANAYMKAETKAKRRVTLSICGLGMLDETEVETIPDAVPGPQPRPDHEPGPFITKAQADRIVRAYDALGVTSKAAKAADLERSFGYATLEGLSAAKAEEVALALEDRVADLTASEATKRDGPAQGDLAGTVTRGRP